MATMRRGFAGRVPFSLLAVLLLVARPLAGEEAAPLDPMQLLEGLAPLAEHGIWTVTTEDDRSPEPLEALPGLSGRDQARYGHGLTRLTTRRYVHEPEQGWTRGITMQLHTFRDDESATAFRRALDVYFSREEPRSDWTPREKRPLDLDPQLGQGFAYRKIFELGEDLLLEYGLAVQRGPTVLLLGLGNCDHISIPAATAFVEYALRRLTEPTRSPPPSPPFDVGQREVELRIKTPRGVEVGTVDVAWRRVTGKVGTPERLGPPWRLTLPQAMVHLRIGHAMSSDGRPLLLLGRDLVIDSTANQVECVLDEARPLEVRVLDSRGQPLAGARVQTFSRPPPRGLEIGFGVVGRDPEPEPVEEVVRGLGDGLGLTDGRGLTTVAVHPRVRSLLTVARGDHFVPRQSWVAPATKSRSVTLEPGWTLRTSIVDATGTPLVCSVQVKLESGPAASQETDAEGRIVLGPIPLQRAALKVWAPGSWDDRSDAWHAFDPTTQTPTLTVPCRQLDVSVVGPDGERVPRCWLRLAWPTGSTLGGVLWEEPRRIAVPLGPYVIEATQAEDHDDSALGLRTTSLLVEDDRREVILQMEEGRDMQGVLLDPDGQPVAGATVHARSDRIEVAESTTDDAGKFRLRGLGDEPITIEVDSPPPLAPTLARGVQPLEQDEFLELRLPKAITVSIEDPDGAPVEGAYVGLWMGPGLGELVFERHTDESGSVYLPVIGPDMLLVVNNQSDAPMGNAQQTWDGQPVTIRLPRAYRVDVLVTDAQGPVMGAEVELEGTGVHFDATGPGGRTRITDAPEQAKRLRVRRSASLPWSDWVPVQRAPLVTRVRLADAPR